MLAHVELGDSTDAAKGTNGSMNVAYQPEVIESTITG